MQLKAILERLQKQPGFVYGKVQWAHRPPGRPELHVQLRPRKGSHPVCSGCGLKRPCYDRLRERRFRNRPIPPTRQPSRAAVDHPRILARRRRSDPLEAGKVVDPRLQVCVRGNGQAEAAGTTGVSETLLARRSAWTSVAARLSERWAGRPGAAGDVATVCTGEPTAVVGDGEGEGPGRGDDAVGILGGLMS